MSKVKENYAALAAAIGFQYDSSNSVLCGKKDGFDMVIYAADSRYPYMLQAHIAARRTGGGILTKDEVKEFTKSEKCISYLKQEGTTVFAGLGNQPKLEKLISNVTQGLNALTAFLRRMSFEPCCNICGQSSDVTPYKAGGKYYHLCEECGTKMRGDLAMLTQKKQQKKENMIGGIVGALLGSLLGVACIIILSRMGYVAALSGVIMAVGVLKGYELLGGKLSNKGIVISSIIMLIMTYVGDRLDWAILLLGEGGGAEAGYNLFECYRLVPETISLGIIELGNYVTGLFMIYIFLLLGAVPTIISKVKEQKEAAEMVQIGSAVNFGAYNQ